MQVTETLNEGLKREISVRVPAGDMEAKLMEKLTAAKDKVRLNGFRPGKVPVQHLRKVYGKSFMAEVVNELLSDSTRTVLNDRGEKAALQPEINMTEDEAEAEKVLAGEADFEFSLAYEVVPQFDLKDTSKIKVTRPVVDIPDDEVEEQVMRVAESARPYEPKKGKAESGDRVTMNFVGKIDGEAFEGGAGEDQNLVLGSGQFIPGFEDQLVGAKAGDEKQVNVTFPADYSAAHLAGKDAVFDVTVTEIAKPGDFEVDDEVAKQLGIESAERVREIVRGQIESQYGALTRQKVKRQILDALDNDYDFEAPSKLVEAEFNNIWAQVERDLEREGKTFKDEDTTEEEAREEYQKLAERRVRLGLVLSAIGEKAEVQITDDEMQRALMETVRMYPGQEQQVYDHYRNNPEAMADFRAPLFEEKVVDHLLTEIDVTDKTVTKEEILADDDEDEKPAKKKAAPKKKAAAKSASAEKKAPAKKTPAKKKAPAKASADKAEK